MTTTLTVVPPATANLPAPEEFARGVLALPPLTSAAAADAAATLLTMAVELRDMVRAHYDPVVEAANATHKAACAARTTHLEAVEMAEKHLRKLLTTYASAKIPGQRAPAGVQVVKGKAKLRILDASAIPREFLAPDEDKILAMLKAGGHVPGCEMFQDSTVRTTKAKAGPSAPGVVLYDANAPTVAP